MAAPSVAATSDSLQGQVDALQACCPVICPAIIPTGYETQDLFDLLQHAGKDSIDSFGSLLGTAAEGVSSCCVCGADGKPCSSSGSSSDSDEDEDPGPSALYFTVLTGLDFKTRSVILKRAGFACLQCRALRSTTRLLRFAGLRVGDGSAEGPARRLALLHLAAHAAATNRAPEALQASPEALGVWLQELACRAYALQVVASNLGGWKVVGPAGQPLPLGRGKEVVAAASLLLAASAESGKKGKAGRKQGKAGKAGGRADAGAAAGAGEQKAAANGSAGKGRKQARGERVEAEAAEEEAAQQQQPVKKRKQAVAAAAAAAPAAAGAKKAGAGQRKGAAGGAAQVQAPSEGGTAAQPKAAGKKRAEGAAPAAAAAGRGGSGPDAGKGSAGGGAAAEAKGAKAGAEAKGEGMKRGKKAHQGKQAAGDAGAGAKADRSEPAVAKPGKQQGKAAAAGAGEGAGPGKAKAKAAAGGKAAAEGGAGPAGRPGKKAKLPKA